MRSTDISSIETYLVGQLTNVVSRNVYASTLPSTLPTNNPDMAVVDCVNAITDYRGYRKGTVNVILYCKPDGGRKNVNVLAQMENAFDNLMERIEDEDYVVEEIYRKSDYDSTRDLHYIVIAINLIII
jgi:hypothetical protein